MAKPNKAGAKSARATKTSAMNGATAPAIPIGILALSTEEKQISRGAQRCLTACFTAIKTNLPAQIKTPNALMEFVTSGRAYFERWYASLQAAAGAASVPAKPKSAGARS